jgi:hypothetical protein
MTRIYSGDLAVGLFVVVVIILVVTGWAFAQCPLLAAHGHGDTYMLHCRDVASRHGAYLAFDAGDDFTQPLPWYPQWNCVVQERQRPGYRARPDE